MLIEIEWFDYVFELMKKKKTKQKNMISGEKPD